MDDLDEIDLGILHLLQEDARATTPVDISEELPVSDQTVRNRIDEMRDAGVIRRFVPVIDYETAGFPIRIQFTCSAAITERGELAEAALDVEHVVNVEELLSANHNVRVLAVTNDSEELNRVAARLDDLGLTIERQQLQRDEHRKPFDHFGTDAVSTGSDPDSRPDTD